MGAPGCPTPQKKAYMTKREAIRVAIRLSRKFIKPSRVYRCVPGCGRYHLTTRRSW